MQRSISLKKVFISAMVVLLAGTISLNAAKVVEQDDDQGYLGISIERISTKQKKELGISHGIRVTDVKEKSAAAVAGLKKNDVILFFNNQKILTTSDLTDAVRETRPDQQVNATILRDHKRLEKKIKIGKYDPFVFYFGDENNVFISSMSKKGYLGVNLHEMDADLSTYFKVKKNAGVLILSVQAESAAEAAGIKSGDVIVQIEGEDIANPDHARTVLDEFQKGDKIQISLLRRGEKKKVTVELKGFSYGEGYLKEFLSPSKDMIFDLRKGSRMHWPKQNDRDVEVEIHTDNIRKKISAELKKVKSGNRRSSAKVQIISSNSTKFI